MKARASRALEVNLADYRVDVVIDPKYKAIQEVMAGYEGLEKILKTFLEELCHPRKNWQFIVTETRKFSLGYFYDLKTHPKGPDAVKLYIEASLDAVSNAKEVEVKTDAFNNLFLLLQKFIKEGGSELERFLPVLEYAFKQLKAFPDDLIAIAARSYYQLKKLAEAFSENTPPETDKHALNSLLNAYFRYTYSYWLSEKDPGLWFDDELTGTLPIQTDVIFRPLSHHNLNMHMKNLDRIQAGKDSDAADILVKLLELPGYGDIVRLYRELPGRIFDAVNDEKLKHEYKLLLLFHAMNTPGLSGIHEETLGEIARDMEWLISHEDLRHVQALIETTFRVLRKNIEKYPAIVLRSILSMGKVIYSTDESELVHFFNRYVAGLGFQTPDFRGISNDWQIQSNLAHIQNIRTWMELTKLDPAASKKLLSSLIIHISLSGVLIKDTDLFPRDITAFLNCDIEPVYNLVKQLMRLFPAYFNEIGAEGQLRDISTRIDEACNRKDVLIHFLRKQSHVESSNRIISLIEAVLDFWRTKSKEFLRPYLPANIYDEIRTDGPYVDGVNKVVNHIVNSNGYKKTSDLLSLSDEYLAKIRDEMPEQNSLDIERVSLSLAFYRLLNEKYCINSCEISEHIAQVRSSIPADLEGLRDILEEDDNFKKLSGMLQYLQQMKKVILSRETFSVMEDIYRKRHIAADIPSMYGSYHEAKFDAMGMTFRLESLVNALFDNLTENFDLDFINHDTFRRIYEFMKLFQQALEVDGISTREFEHQLNLLERALKIKLFTFSQYMDIFRGFSQVVSSIVSRYFNNVHRKNLQEIFNLLPEDKLLPKYRQSSDDRKELFQMVSEIFLRDTIATSLGLQRLDVFLLRIINTVFKQAEKFHADRHYLLLTYNPQNIVTSIADPDSRLLDVINMGNKGLNIVKMKSLGLPVPPGFIITTEVFRCREIISGYAPARNNFREQVDREILLMEKLTGKKFGAVRNAMLVSVRSGAAVSQPGMMDSYLNVGMNEEIVKGIIEDTGEAWFAWDSYRRFLQSYGMSFGLPRDGFDAIISEFKIKYGVPLKKDLSSEQMKEVALSYREFIKSREITVEENPREQLYTAIAKVMDSWNSEKAHAYRRIIGISDDWGTAVTVQAMVFGNLSQLSGSGVLFTHNPKLPADMLRPWGDYTIGNQGEDVVSGLVITHPISAYQGRKENRDEDSALENRFPEIYNALTEYAKKLVHEYGWDPQDIEFTFEGPQRENLFLLQTRNMEMGERKRLPSFADIKEMEEKLIGHGIGVSGGALAGRVVFGLDDISHWRRKEPGTPLILVRSDTVPDDIKEIFATEGLLTARGGATSHAAIVAKRLGKTCVAGCRDLICMEKDRKFILNRKDVKAGDFVSLDGAEGSVYLGKMKIIERGE